MSTTRFGRSVKKPDRYEPVEKVEDDYSPSDYDEGGLETEDLEDVDDDEEDEEDDEEDADENGNLNGFVIPDEDKSVEDDDYVAPNESEISEEISEDGDLDGYKSESDGESSTHGEPPVFNSPVGPSKPNSVQRGLKRPTTAPTRRSPRTH